MSTQKIANLCKTRRKHPVLRTRTIKKLHRAPERSQEASNDVINVHVIQSNPQHNCLDDDELICVHKVSSSKTSARPPKKQQCTRDRSQTNLLNLCPLLYPYEEGLHCIIDTLVSQKNLHCHCGSTIKLPKGLFKAAKDHWGSFMSN